MKKLVAIFIITFHFVSFTTFQELMKLPVLIQHFFEHKSLNHNITFLTYLTDHYNDIPHQDNDEERDNQLPFKSPDAQHVCSLNLLIPQLYVLTPKTPGPVGRKIMAVYCETYIPDTRPGKIWQPPKQLA